MVVMEGVMGRRVVLGVVVVVHYARRLLLYWVGWGGGRGLEGGGGWRVLCGEELECAWWGEMET